MSWFAAMSIRNKLTLIIAAVASAVVLLTTCAYVAAQVYASKLDLIETQATLANVFGRELAGPLAFEDERGAISVLEALLEAPGVVGAKIAWPDQTDFVSVGRLDTSGDRDASGHVFSLGGLHTLQPITLDDQTLGILHVSSTLDKLNIDAFTRRHYHAFYNKCRDASRLADREPAATDCVRTRRRTRRNHRTFQWRRHQWLSFG